MQTAPMIKSAAKIYANDTASHPAATESSIRAKPVMREKITQIQNRTNVEQLAPNQAAVMVSSIQVTVKIAMTVTHIKRPTAYVATVS